MRLPPIGILFPPSPRGPNQYRTYLPAPHRPRSVSTESSLIGHSLTSTPSSPQTSGVLTFRSSETRRARQCVTSFRSGRIGCVFIEEAPSGGLLGVGSDSARGGGADRFPTWAS